MHSHTRGQHFQLSITKWYLCIEFLVSNLQLEKKVRQLDEGLRKSDRDYHDGCQKAESARQEWESSVYKV